MKHIRIVAVGLVAITTIATAVLLSNMLSTKALSQYTTTVTNFDPAARQVTRFDVNGNAVDAHDGDMAYFNGKYYLYGTSYNCGYKLQVTGTPFCGFKSYSSTDLVHWTDEGFLFDASTAAWQSSCAAPRFGCYRPHVLYNSATSQYVLWINSYDNASGFHVFTATNPQGPYTEQAQPVMADQGTPGSFINGDMDLFQDDNGTAYIAYTNIQAGHSIKIQQLNSSYTSGTGSAITAVTSSAESPSLFRRGATYYLVYTPPCPYCGGTSTQYKTASSPLGTWSAPTQISANSCGGQASFVAKLPGVSGDNYMYGSDLWKHSDPNQALANYFWKPLTFSGTAINAITCSNTFTVTLGDGALGHDTFPTGADQSSGTNFFRTYCDISSVWSRLQTFSPGRSGKLNTVSFTGYRHANPNGDLKLDIVMTDGNGAQLGSALYSTSIPASTVGWSPRQITISPNISVHGGTRYAVVAWSPATTNGGCYGFSYNDYTTYQFGKAGYLPTTGGWTAEPARSLKFQTTIN